MSAPAKSPLAQPLIKSGARYTVELGRCIVFGVLLCIVSAVVFFSFAGEGALVHRGVFLLATAVGFPLLYAIAGHQRAIGRALATLSRSHGGFLYDHTMGRFIEAVEARPGGFASVLASPAKLVRGFRSFLQESPAMPRMIRRVALRYVDRVGERLRDSSTLPPDILRDGKFNAPAFKHWAVERMHDQFLPSWTGFGIVAGLQVLGTAALLWGSR